MSTTKEITESLGFGVIFATVKALVDYASEKKVTVYFSEKNNGNYCWRWPRIRFWENQKMVTLDLE